MENLTGGTPPVRPLPCVVPCKLYFPKEEIASALIESGDTGYLGQKSYLSRKLIVVSAYFEILMPYLTPLQQSLLNVAIVDAYKAKGITRDNRSILNEDGSYKEMPIISDVCIALKDISLDIPIFLALIQFSEKDISINFYDNKQL